jgi:hypothetical protein
MRVAVLSLCMAFAGLGAGLGVGAGMAAAAAPPAPPPLPDTPSQPPGPPHCTDVYGAYFPCPEDLVAPKGATARCLDKSFSKGPRDPKDCRGHGGVEFYLPKPEESMAPATDKPSH